MKIVVIGANGRLGSKIVDCALSMGHQIKAIDLGESRHQEKCEILEKSLFDLNFEDVKGYDAIISAFGGGFKVDPVINYEAFKKYIELCKTQYLVTIAGAGCLFTDETHSLYEYQSDGHPEKLRGISENNLKGINALKNNKLFGWCVVCPSRFFDFEGRYTNDYIISDKEEIIYNDENSSYVSYEDLAKAMIDLALSQEYCHKVVTIASKKGGK